MKQLKRFVILDRDGTVIVERHYLNDPDKVELLPNAIAGIRKIRKLGLGIVLVTNQSGIARRLFSLETLNAIHARLEMYLQDAGIGVDGIYFCPHGPGDGCDCRKPNPGLVERARRELEFDPSEAFVVGDKACDVELGRRLGAVTLLVGTGYGRQHLCEGLAKPDYFVADLQEAADVIGRLLSP